MQYSLKIKPCRMFIHEPSEYTTGSMYAKLIIVEEAHGMLPVLGTGKSIKKSLPLLSKYRR